MGITKRNSVAMGIIMAVVAALLLAGCGGGSGSASTVGTVSGSGSSFPVPGPAFGIVSDGGSNSPASSTLGGVAAVGTPIVGGAINVSCAAGSQLATTTDSTTGAWQVTLTGQALPCAVQVTGGTINGLTNATPYHSIAVAAGTVNVTPLTDLMVANLTGTSTPSIWFAGLSATPAPLNNINQAAVNGALAKLSAALPALTSLGAINPITTAFTPTPGNASDDMLTSLHTAIANTTGITYTSLMSDASSPAFIAPVPGFGAALMTAYSGRTSGGTYTISGTVSGLTGTVVLLQGNHGDKLAINANGAFTFAIPVASGSIWALGSANHVTILTQPLGQTCAVMGGGGMETGNLTGVAVNCTDVTGLPAGYFVQGGLTWMPVTSDRLLTWPDANAYCTGTAINGQAGWRLPTQSELRALYDSGAMNGQGWTLSNIWTSTPNADGNYYAIYMGAFPIGGTVSLFFTYNLFVTCVR